MAAWREHNDWPEKKKKDKKFSTSEMEISCVFIYIVGALFILPLSFGATYDGFRTCPQDEIVVNSTNITVCFACKYPRYDHDWSINGYNFSAFSADHENVYKRAGELCFSGINGIPNNTIVVCKVLTPELSVVTNATANLILQGTLPSVDLNGTWNAKKNTMFFTWKPPYMLPLTRSSVIIYAITVYFPNGTVLFKSELAEQYYAIQEPPKSLIVTVVATNEAGEGEPKTERFELPFPETTGGISTTASGHDTTTSLPNTPIKELIISAIVTLLVVAVVVAVAVTFTVCVFKKCPKDKLKSRGRSQRSLRRNSTCSQEDHQQYDIDQDAANVTVGTVVTELETSIQDHHGEIKIKDDSETEVPAQPADTSNLEETVQPPVESAVESTEDGALPDPKIILMPVHLVCNNPDFGELATIRRKSETRDELAKDHRMSGIDFTSDASDCLPSPEEVNQEKKWIQTSVPSVSKPPRRARRVTKERNTEDSEPLSDQSVVENFSEIAGGDSNTIIPGDKPTPTGESVQPPSVRDGSLGRIARQKLVASTITDQPDTAATTTTTEVSD